MRHIDFLSISEKELLDHIERGSELAFSQLFDRYWEPLMEVALKVLKDADASQDAVQEVFTDFWRKREVSKIHNLQAYLHQATRYKVIDHIRKQRIPMSSLDFVEHFQSSASVEQIIHHRELSEMIEASVRQLPEQCQRIFRMSRFEQLSNKEIAEQLKISVRTVESHISHAIKFLRANVDTAAVVTLWLGFP